MSPGCFVTGTDTGVGKTVVTAAICAALRASGGTVRARKPVLSGLDDPGPHDDELLALAAGCDRDEVTSLRFGPAVSPHLAAELAGAQPDWSQIAAGLAGPAADPSVPLVVEGVGGLLVPLGDGWDVRRLAATVALPLIVVARSELGTINHTLMTLEAARVGSLEVAGVVFNRWPDRPASLHRSNLETVRRLGEVDVATFPELSDLGPATLAAAGAGLPLRRWLAASG